MFVGFFCVCVCVCQVKSVQKELIVSQLKQTCVLACVCVCTTPLKMDGLTFQHSSIDPCLVIHKSIILATYHNDSSFMAPLIQFFLLFPFFQFSFFVCSLVIVLVLLTVFMAILNLPPMPNKMFYLRVIFFFEIHMRTIKSFYHFR